MRGIQSETNNGFLPFRCLIFVLQVKEAFRILDKDGKGEIHTDVIKEILKKLDDVSNESLNHCQTLKL